MGSINGRIEVQADLDIKQEPTSKITKTSWVLVAHPCNPNSQEAEIRRIVV
jgi:hypothetical protein